MIIYKIKNIINGKIYIGQTVRPLKKRICEYKYSLSRDYFYNQYLHNAFKKYGWDNFKFEIIDTAKSVEELNEKEIHYISEYNSNNRKFGYNIETGGKNSLPAQETLNKMSKSHLGIKQSDSWIKKRIALIGSDNAKKYGKTKTDEEKKYLSENSPKFWKGKNRNDKTKQKISETKLKNGLSDKQKEVICKNVYKINPENNEIVDVFESTSIAAKSIGVNQSTVSRWCQKNKTVKGFLWKYNV